MKRLLLSILLFVSVLSLWAQNTCTDQLRVAQRRFDDGLLDEIPNLLASCMKDGFTSEEKTNAYKLLIQTYLFNEQPEKADEVMMQFLKEFPGYTIATNDPKEFINLYRTYRTEPIFKIEAKVGGSLCTPYILEPNGVGNIESKQASYKPLIGLAAELNFIDRLFKNFDYSIGASFNLSRLSYSYKPYDYSSVTGTYSNMYIGLPISVRYNFKYLGINLFARVGLEPVYLLSSKIDLTRKDDISTRTEPFTGSEDITSQHRKFDIKPSIAIGPTFKVWNGQLRVTFEVKLGTVAQTSNSDKYTNSVLYNKYFFVEDKMLINQANLAVAYVLPIYKPKKIR